MSIPLPVKTLFAAIILSLSSALTAGAQTISMHQTTDLSGAEGNELQFVAQHTGALPGGVYMHFYVEDSRGVTTNLGYHGDFAGNLWTKKWTATEPGAYKVYAMLRAGYWETADELARTAPVTVTITGSAVAMHATTETSGAQGNELRFVAQHTGTLPAGVYMHFYVEDSRGVTTNLEYHSSFAGNLWSKEWTATEPGVYKVYVKMRAGYWETADELARTEPVTVTITGSAVAMHATTERSGAQGNELRFVAQHTGTLPAGVYMHFYVEDSRGVTTELGYHSSFVENLWSKQWTAKEPGVYKLYVKMRAGYWETAKELARTAPVTVTIVGSAVAMHSSSSRFFVAGKPVTVVAATSGRLPDGTRVFFYAIDQATEMIDPLGANTRVVEQLWLREWTPEKSTVFKLYAVLVNRSGQEIARSGGLLVVPQGTKVPLPFEAAAGAYQALLPGDARPMLNVQLAANGAVTGKLVLEGLSYSFKGTMDGNGTATIRSDLRNQPSLTIVLRSDFGSQMMTGTYRIGEQSMVGFSLLTPAYSGKSGNVSPLAKKTANVLLAPEMGAGDAFLGHGYFRATFDAKGGARITGKMPDGRTVSGYLPALSSGVAGESILPMFAVWKGKSLATLKGELEVREAGGESVPLLEGILEWVVPGDGQRPVLPAAYQATFSAVGNLWAPAPGTSVLTGLSGGTPFLLQADDGGRILSSAASLSGTWGVNNVPVFANLPAGAKWSFSAKTGILSGKFPDAGTEHVFSAMLVPSNGFEVNGRALRGAGFMIGKSSSAALEITTED